MTDEPIKAADFAKQLLILNQQIANLRASLNVLKVLEAMRLSPDDVPEGLKGLRQLEEKQLNSDPHEQARKEAFDLIDAVEQWKQLGGQHGRS
jgi:hypothetical protein